MSRSPSRSPRSVGITQRPQGTNLVLVTNLSPSIQREDLEFLFERYGRVDRIESNSTAGTAQIFFEDSRDAADAVRDLNGRDVGGRRIQVSIYSAPRSVGITQRPQGSNLVLVTNLSPSIQREDLEFLFGRYGRVDRIEPNSTAGTAQIFFEDSRDAADAVRDLNGRDVGGSRIQVSIYSAPQEGISSRRYLLVAEANRMIQSGLIIQSIIDPENQQEVPVGLTRITLIGIDGQEYDVLARYDQTTNQIYPPR